MYVLSQCSDTDSREHSQEWCPLATISEGACEREEKLAEGPLRGQQHREKRVQDNRIQAGNASDFALKEISSKSYLNPVLIVGTILSYLH